MSGLERSGLQAHPYHIGRKGGRRPGPKTPRGVRLPHALSLPFENLDAVSGRARRSPRLIRRPRWPLPRPPLPHQRRLALRELQVNGTRARE